MNFLGKELGKNKPPFIVAEISCNHEGNLQQAKDLIYHAKRAGADAVKIQVYTPEDMTINAGGDITHNYNPEFYIQAGPWKGKQLWELYTKTQTHYALAEKLFDYALVADIPMFASVFSEKGVDFLESIECPAYKIASFEITDIPLIEKVAKTNKPMVISTGMATEDEIYKALSPIRLINNCILLHCVSAYPTPLEETNLWRIEYLRKEHGDLIGFSDHTTGHLAAQIACGMGACMIEKHLYTGAPGGEDAGFSLTPAAFGFFVKACKRAAEVSFESISIGEQSSKQFRRSLYVVKDIARGETFTKDNIRSIRPSFGLSPVELPNILGKQAKTDIPSGTALKRTHIDE